MRNFWIGLVVTLCLIGVGLYLGMSVKERPGITEYDVRQMIITTIQQDADTSVFITGYLDLFVEIHLTDTKKIWPGLSLGTNEVDLRVPGRASYGFSLEDFSDGDVDYSGGDTVDVYLPDIGIYSVETDLENLDMRTDMGWARFYSYSGRRMEREALRQVPGKIRETAEKRLSDSDQPYEHTVRSVVALLTPVLKAGGLSNPVVRVYRRAEPLMSGQE